MRFCPNCGRSETETRLLGSNFCPDCYRSLHPLLVTPSYVSLGICPRCESIRVKKRWLGPIGVGEAAGMALRQVHDLRGSTTIEFEDVNIPVYAPEARFNLTVRGQSSDELPPHTEIHLLLVRLHWEPCSDCLQSSRKILAYKVQVRSDVGFITPNDRRAMDRALNEALYLHPSRFERREVAGGVDLEFENPRTSGELLALLRSGRKAEERASSEGVVRLPTGDRVVKRTYVFRFPSLKVGELIHMPEGDVRVERLAKGHAQILDLKTHKRSALPIERLFDAKSAVNRE